MALDMTKAARTVLFRWEETLAVIALAVVVFAVSYGVVTRHLTQTSATWATELANLSFTWVVFLGAAGAMRRNMHVSVDAVVRLLPDRLASILEWLTNFLVMAFLAYGSWLAITIMIDAHDRPSPVLRISFTWVYLAVVLSFCSMFIQHSLSMLRQLRGEREDLS